MAAAAPLGGSDTALLVVLHGTAILLVALHGAAELLVALYGSGGAAKWRRCCIVGGAARTATSLDGGSATLLAALHGRGGTAGWRCRCIVVGFRWRRRWVLDFFYFFCENTNKKNRVYPLVPPGPPLAYPSRPVRVLSAGGPTGVRSEFSSFGPLKSRLAHPCSPLAHDPSLPIVWRSLDWTVSDRPVFKSLCPNS
jgi:hypothetical protein